MAVLVFNKLHKTLESFRSREEAMNEYLDEWLEKHPEWADELIVIEVSSYNVLKIKSKYSLEHIPYK